MNRETITKLKIQELISRHKKYDLPAFLRIIRTVLGLNRMLVGNECAISMQRLFSLEKGQFKKRPSSEILEILGDYYGVPQDLLEEKANELMIERCKKMRANKSSK